VTRARPRVGLRHGLPLAPSLHVDLDAGELLVERSYVRRGK
jgi:hypothetical protein